MKVSIIMPYYKKSSYIDETVNSLLNQTFKEFEIIIVDDELSEDSSKVLSRIKQLDKRIYIFKIIFIYHKNLHHKDHKN